MSVHDLATQLPAPEQLKRYTQALAMIDAIVTGEGYRVFGFDAHWAPGQQLASMDDGGGNGWSITFTAAGAWLRGFDHESALSPWDTTRHEDWLSAVPEPLKAAAAEPAFTLDDTPMVSMAMWWLPDSTSWTPVHLREVSEKEAGDDGSYWLLQEVTGGAAAIVQHVEEVDEMQVSLDDVEHILAHRALTPELVTRMNPACDWTQTGIEAQRIGYPWTEAEPNG